MIAVWIVGGSFLIVGFLYALPRYLRLFRCRAKTVGILTKARSAHGTGPQPVRAGYRYFVDGVEYTASTGWTNFGSFRVGERREIRYDPHRPQRSYLPHSGQLFGCLLGTLFALTGAGVLCIGLWLQQIL